MAVLLVTGLRSIGVMGVEVRELQLTFADDKAVVQLPMLNDEFATHLCVPSVSPTCPSVSQGGCLQNMFQTRIAGTFRTTGGTHKSSAVC